MFSLTAKETRHCSCGKTSGQYVSAHEATYSGPCVPLAFGNDTFYRALARQPLAGRGDNFTAFVIPMSNDVMKRVETPPPPSSD